MMLLVLDDFGFVYRRGTKSKQAIWCLCVLRLILSLLTS